MSLDALIASIWEGELLIPYRKQHIFAQETVATHAYPTEGVLLAKGNTYKIPQLDRSSATISDYDPATGLADPETVNGTTIDLVVERAWSWNVRVGSIEQAQAQPALMEGAISERAYLLNDAQDQYLAGKVIAGGTVFTGGTAGLITLPHPANSADTVPGDAARNFVVDMGTQLSTQAAPTEGRWLIAHPSFTGLLMKAKVLTNLAGSLGDQIVRNGYVGRLGGFDVLESLNVPADTVVGGVPGAFAMVDQINSIEAYLHPKFFGENVRGLLVSGAKVIRANGLVVSTWEVA